MSITTPDDPLLFTPGPLTTSLSVKQAMLHDAGSRDERFIERVRRIRQSLLALGGVSREKGYEAVLIQGSGTFGVEAALTTLIPHEGNLLVLINGAYGERMHHIAQRLSIQCRTLSWPEDTSPDPGEVREFLQANPQTTHVAVVHCETTTGILNPLPELAAVVRQAGCRLLVDAMSSFGAYPLAMDAVGIDALVSSANKCIEGVPGFSFVLVKRDWLETSEGQARSLCLDLHAQWAGLEKNGQFRFTPPTHALLAFHQALEELQAEGGVAGRAARYQANHVRLLEGMKSLGFRPYLPSDRQSYVITAFHYPSEPAFQFDRFYQELARRGMIIYPGKLSQVDCFRVGSIGRLHPQDMDRLLEAIKDVLGLMELAGPDNMKG